MEVDWEGRGISLDEACRLEAAMRLRPLGNAALNSSRLQDASRKYVKALAYPDELVLHGETADAVADE